MLFQPALLRNVQLDLASLTQLPDLPPLWALHDLFPCHRLSLVAAPTGSGLTQLACHLASALATQPGVPAIPMVYPAANPDGSLPEPILAPGEDPRSCPSVLLISHRDGPDVLKPRLQALGVDPDQVLVLSSVHRELPRIPNQPPRTRSAPFSLADLDALSEVLHEHTTIRLVLIDNADLLFAASNDPARAKVQRELDALASVADQHEIAIVLLAGVPQLQRNPFASRLFAAMRDACRLVYFMAPDLDDPEHRLLFCIKNTLTRSTSTRKLQPLCPASPASFRALTTELQSLTLPHYFALLHRQKAAATLTGPSPAMHDYACEFLQHTLASGPVPVGACTNPAPGTLRYLAQQAGCAWGTILRAKRTLQIASHFTQDHWTWHLPSTIPQLPACPIPNPESPIPNSPSSSSTKNQVPSTPSRTCAPAPQNSAQPPSQQPPTSPHPTPARTCASAPPVAQASSLAVPAVVLDCRADGQTDTRAPEPSPAEPSIAPSTSPSSSPPLPHTLPSSFFPLPSSPSPIPQLGASPPPPNNVPSVPNLGR